MFRSRLIITSIFLSSIGLVAAVMAGERSEFEKWMNQETQSYQEYRDKRQLSRVCDGRSAKAEPARGLLGSHYGRGE